MKINVSIIILNWNSYNLTKKCLLSLKKSTNLDCAEVIVVDNGSIDGSGENIKKEFPWIKLIRSEKNLGFGGGCNLGMKHAKGNYFLLLNNDIVFYKDCLSDMVRLANSDEKIAAVGLADSVSTYLSIRGIRGFFYRILFCLTFQRTPIKKYDGIKYMKADNLVFAAVLLRRDVIKRVGYLDAKNFYPIYGEDQDWCYRAKNAGYKLLWIFEDGWKHLGSITTKKAFKKERDIMLEKHRIKAMFINLKPFDLFRLLFAQEFFRIIYNFVFDRRKLIVLLKAYMFLIKEIEYLINLRKTRIIENYKIRKN
jgi:GT2 family glycosyltransferase